MDSIVDVNRGAIRNKNTFILDGGKLGSVKAIGCDTLRGHVRGHQRRESIGAVGTPSKGGLLQPPED